MGTGGGWSLAGMEVPLLSTDTIEWRQVAVPSTSAADNSDHPLCKDYSSCCTIGDPPSYFIGKTSKDRPNSLEIIELSCEKEKSRIGLRVIFPDALFPFAFICNDESIFSSKNHLLLYALTISGTAYLIRLRDNFQYGASSILSTNEFLEYRIQTSPNNGGITAVAATAGCLFLGRNDGSICCFMLGSLDPTDSGFLFELRDDGGFGRLWGILSRGPLLAAVQDLVISEVRHRKLLFVLHSDGSFRVWDLLGHGRVFGHAMTIPTFKGEFERLWVGEINANDILPVAILQKQNLEVSTGTIFLYGLHFNLGDRIQLSLEPSSAKISLGKGGPIDVKLTSSEVWILKEEALIVQSLFGDHSNKESAYYYALQETYVSDLLFQSSDHSSDDLLWLAFSVFSPAKEEVVPLISSIFLRALLLPGVLCTPVLRKTLGDYNKHFTNSEFGSFTVDGLKREILSVIEYQGGSDNPVSILQRWNSFCNHYVNNWCKYNAACGLLLDPLTGAIGLVRSNGLSLCRGLVDAEHVINGSSEKQNSPIRPIMDYSSSELDQRIQFEVLQCVRYVSQQLGKASSAIFYESLLRLPYASFEEVVPRFLKILETGYSYSIAAIKISELGADTALEKESWNRTNLRKFSVNMYLSLQALYHKAGSWGKVFDVILSYLKFLVPQKVKLDVGENSHLHGSAVVQATSQIARMTFQSSFEVLMLLNYVASISGQISMSHDDVLRVKLDLIPLIQENVAEWHIIHFLGTTPSESPAVEDFSYQLSSLQIDSKVDKRLWISRLGKCEFPLAFILLPSMQCSLGKLENIVFCRLPNQSNLINLSQEFISWIIWGRGEDSSIFFSNSIDLAIVLLIHGQYNAAEYLLTSVNAYLRKESLSESLQAVAGKISTLFHLLGCCLVAQSHHGLHGQVQERKVGEAIRCFFRAVSTEESSNALRSLPCEADWLSVNFGVCLSNAAWKLQYFQWVMQLFEQYNLSDAARQFTLAALEQVDETLRTVDSSSRENLGDVVSVKGRLWANVFKFTLDLKNYSEAYCAIISNPDQESKCICLRRFVIVLYEHRATKILCDGQFPLIGLEDKVERELASKAERSNLSTKPNPFKFLYAFEVRRHNWRRAANCMYMYSMRLRAEAAVKKDHHLRSATLQERLNGLAVAINALQLVHLPYTYIDVPVEETTLSEESYPNKKARITREEQSLLDDALLQSLSSYLDVEKIEEEYVLTSAEYFLNSANISWTFDGIVKPTGDLINLLVESNFYDMAFTVILKFWKGSGLQRELEKAFIAMALKCCPIRQVPVLHERDRKMGNLLLTSSEDVVRDSLHAATMEQQRPGCSHWERLEIYLEKYKALHPRLPLIVAGTLLSTDSQVELPLWLIRHFKVDNSKGALGMTGNQPDPASLFGLYVDFGRYAEAVKLLIEYMEALASLRPLDVMRRKKPFAVWFPYTSIEHLWCLLEESIRSGHRIDQHEKLKNLLHGVLANHLSLVKVDSDDVNCES